MDDLFRIVQSLQTDFFVTHFSKEELVLKVQIAMQPANLRFSRPRQAWAYHWDTKKSEWQAIPEFSIPHQGFMQELHIKRLSHGINMSFSNGQESLIRWGFTADALTIEHCT